MEIRMINLWIWKSDLMRLPVRGMLAYRYTMLVSHRGIDGFDWLCAIARGIALSLGISCSVGLAQAPTPIGSNQSQGMPSTSPSSTVLAPSPISSAPQPSNALSGPLSVPNTVQPTNSEQSSNVGQIPNTGTSSKVGQSSNTVQGSVSSSNPIDASPVIPSLQNNQTPAGSYQPKPVGEYALPKNAGQTWMEYDIRPYTQMIKNSDRPQQTIIDWILRETGTDAWFTEPMGILTADRNTLRVYHHATMQKTVSQIYERFVNGVSEPQVFGMRLITISNPHWRSQAIPLMRSAPSKSPGVQAWLMPKENGAIFLSQLRERSDAKELQAFEIPLHNGQLQHLEQVRSRNYLKEFVRNTNSPFPPYTPLSDEIKEGYRLQISPLMSLDGKSADLLLKCEIDQVERLNQVRLDLPVAPNQTQPAQLEVPQIVSWRLQERFQWPTNQVLLLSCGVVATPTGPVENTLFSNPPSLFGINRVIATTGQRADALLWIEYKGSVANTTPTNSSGNTPNAASNNAISRGRY